MAAVKLINGLCKRWDEDKDDYSFCKYNGTVTCMGCSVYRGALKNTENMFQGD